MHIRSHKHTRTLTFTLHRSQLGSCMAWAKAHLYVFVDDFRLTSKTQLGNFVYVMRLEKPFMHFPFSFRTVACSPLCSVRIKAEWMRDGSEIGSPLAFQIANLIEMTSIFNLPFNRKYWKIIFCLIPNSVNECMTENERPRKGWREIWCMYDNE